MELVRLTWLLAVLYVTAAVAKKDRDFLRRVGRHVAARYDEQSRVHRSPQRSNAWPAVCPEFDSMPSERKFARLRRGHVPFVVRNATRFFDANVRKLADPAFLVEQLGGEQVSVSVFPAREHLPRGMHKSIFPTNASMWYPDLDAGQERELLVNPFRRDMNVAAAVKALWDGEEALAMEQLPLFTEGEQCDLPLSFLKRVLSTVPPLFGSLELSSINLFIGNVFGGRGRHTPLHFDDNDNFLLQLQGRKKVLLFSHADSHNLYSKTMLRTSAVDPSSLEPGEKNRPRLHRRDLGVYEYMERAQPGSPVNPDFEDSDGLTDNFSPVDTHAIDASRFPHFRSAQPLICTIDQGDLLFIPQLVWHDIQSYGEDRETHDGVNAAVNFWFEGDAHFSALYATLMSLVREGHAGVTGEESDSFRHRGNRKFHEARGRLWEYEVGELGAKNVDAVPPVSSRMLRAFALRRAALQKSSAGVPLFSTRHQSAHHNDYWEDPQEIPQLYDNGRWNEVAARRAATFEEGDDNDDDGDDGDGGGNSEVEVGGFGKRREDDEGEERDEGGDDDE